MIQLKSYLQSRIDQLNTESQSLLNRDTYNAGWLEGSIYNLKEMLHAIESGEITL